MGFQRVAEIIHTVTKVYGGAEAFLKKFDGAGGGTKKYFGSSNAKDYKPSILIVGVVQEEFSEEELTPLGADRRLDLIFNVSSLELAEKNVALDRIEGQQKDLLIFRNVLYNIVKVKFHKLQEIELYRIYCVLETSYSLPQNDPDYSKVIPFT